MEEDEDFMSWVEEVDVVSVNVDVDVDVVGVGIEKREVDDRSAGLAF